MKNRRIVNEQKCFHRTVDPTGIEATKRRFAARAAFQPTGSTDQEQERCPLNLRRKAGGFGRHCRRGAVQGTVEKESSFLRCGRVALFRQQSLRLMIARAGFSRGLGGRFGRLLQNGQGRTAEMHLVAGGGRSFRGRRFRAGVGHGSDGLVRSRCRGRNGHVNVSARELLLSRKSWSAGKIPGAPARGNTRAAFRPRPDNQRERRRSPNPSKVRPTPAAPPKAERASDPSKFEPRSDGGTEERTARCFGGCPAAGRQKRKAGELERGAQPERVSAGRRLRPG